MCKYCEEPTPGKEKLIVGVDPARFSFQAALLSPSELKFNKKLPLNPQSLDKLVNVLREKGEISFVIEGISTFSKAALLHLVSSSIAVYELNPAKGRRLRQLFKEDHLDPSDAEAAAIAGAHFTGLCSRVYAISLSEALSLSLAARTLLLKHKTAVINYLHSLLCETYADLYAELRKKFKITSAKGRKFFKLFSSAQQALQEGELFRMQVGQRLWTQLQRKGAWRDVLFSEVVSWHIKCLLDYVDELEAKIKAIEVKIIELARAHSVWEKLRQIKGIGPVSAATLIAVVKDIRRFETEARFAAYCGLAPRRWQSGLSKERLYRRTMYNRKLKTVFFYIALTAIREDERSRAYYRKKRQEGKSHRQALLSLARQLARVVYHTWKRASAESST